MNRSLLLAVVLCFCGFAPAHAQSSSRWRVFYRSDASTIAYDTTTFTEDDEGVLSVWIQHTYPLQRSSTSGKPFDRKRTWFELDCDNGKVNVLRIIWMLGTEVTESSDYEALGMIEWVRPSPETELEFFLKTFCRGSDG
ncbi:surface-adhesin E family protein [Longimicrobium sp.]|jgi:hypothetical protein|uniref:surface-adhesin E family protein n=1 Tax=Longimicrobium sp. TaxID=2029185 RepID=UPI002EDB0224